MANEKCCFVVDLKMGCYIIGYFLLVIYSVATSLAVYFSLTISMDLSLNDPDATRKLLDIVLLGQFAFPIGLSNIKITIILLVGIHKKLRVLLRLYMIFATFMVSMTVVSCLVLQFLLHKEICASILVLFNTLNAYFIYVIRKYWIHLNPVNVKLLKQTV